MDASARLTTLTRLGFAARGLLYITIAFLVIGTGRTEDPAGALRYLGQGGGRVLLIVMAIGLAAYGLWRLSDAAFNIEGHDRDKKGAGERAGAAASGAVHLFLAWQAVRLIRNVAESSGSGGAEQGAQTALDLPAGALMLVLVGLVLVVTGAVQLVKAVKCSFCDRLDPQIARQDWVRWIGRAGYSARGLIFLISGFFLVGAGLQSQANEAGGMEEALAWLTSPWDVIVALGLLMFGLFSLVEARYRIIHRVPVNQMASRARSKLPT